MSSQPFASFFARNLGHPAVGWGNDWAGSDIEGAALMEAIEGDPRRLRAMMMRRRQHGGGGGGGGFRPRPCQQEDDAGAYFGDDDLSGHDVAMLGELEGEIEDLSDDSGDADVADDAGADEHIGSIQSTGKRMRKLQDKIVELKAELAATPEYKTRKRNRLKKLIAKAEKGVDRKEAKLQKKQVKLARAMGVPVAAVAAAGTAAGMAMGVSGSRVFSAEQRIAEAQGQAAMGLQALQGWSPRRGNEMRLGFVDSVSQTQVGRISVPAGVGLRQSAITMTTPNIAFASFKVIGIDFRLQVNQANGAGGFPLAQLLVNCLINSVLVNGDINLIYSPEDVAMGAQIVGGQLSSSRTIPGLRENPILDRTNNATLNGTFRQELDNTTQIEASYTAALVVERLRDPSAERRA